MTLQQKYLDLESTRKIIKYRASLRWIRETQFRKIDYVPHSDKQLSVHQAIENGATRLALECGRRWAKSTTMAVEHFRQLHFKPFGMLPKRLGWITGPEYDITDPIFEYLWKWIVDDLVFGVKPNIARTDTRIIEMPWGARVQAMTTRNPDSLQGKGVMLITGDEHADDKPGVYHRYLEPVTGDTGGIVMLGSTPDGAFNHYAETCDQFIELAKTNPKYFYLHATSYENPNPDLQAWLIDYKAFCKRTNRMDIFNQEILAKRVSRKGAIYPMFEPNRGDVLWHVRDVEYNPDMPILAGIDWGENFAAVFGQVRDGDCLDIFDEISIVEPDPLKQLAAVIDLIERYVASVPGHRHAAQPLRALEMAYCDPSGKTMKEMFRNHGIQVFEPSKRQNLKINDVENGITDVRALLSKEYMPGIAINAKKCNNLVKTIPDYARNEKTEKPIKENDHGLDALRYLVRGEFMMKFKLPMV